MNAWLPEQIKTCKNLLQTAEILMNIGHEELLPTILEFLFIEVQQINDENCVVEDGNCKGID